MIFASRSVAGRQLARHLVERGVAADLVLGLPRGGLIVAAEVANHLGRPLDALVVRKIGHPRHREFAVGSLAEPDIVLLDEVHVPVDPDELAEVIEEEKARLREYRARFHRHGPPDLKHQAVLLVDDGLATGATMAAAVQAARRLGARRVAVAAPVASDNAWQRLRAVADQVEAVLVDPDFVAVGQYYESFPQTSDDEVRQLLGLRAPPARPDPESL
jgi:putative phosphoribosyl transferase